MAFNCPSLGNRHVSLEGGNLVPLACTSGFAALSRVDFILYEALEIPRVPESHADVPTLSL